MGRIGYALALHDRDVNLPQLRKPCVFCSGVSIIHYANDMLKAGPLQRERITDVCSAGCSIIERVHEFSVHTTHGNDCWPVVA